MKTFTSTLPDDLFSELSRLAERLTLPKNRIIEKIQSNAHIDLKKQTLKNEEKFNLFYIDLK